MGYLADSLGEGNLSETHLGEGNLSEREISPNRNHTEIQMVDRPHRTTRIEIKIDQDVIAEGIRRNSAYCVIAAALKKAIPTATAIRVDLRTIRWSDKSKGERYIYLTPTAGQQTICDFDQGHTGRLLPYTLRLRDGQIIQMRTAERDRISQGKGKGSGNSTRKRKTLVVTNRNETLTIGGRPPPISPWSPSSERVFGGRKLTP
jgi:hypothetical protein